jgi:hypothetical protein
VARALQNDRACTAARSSSPRSSPSPSSLPLLHSSVARADEPVAATSATVSESTPATAAVDRRWYGWQPVMTDVGSIGTMMLATATRGPESETIGILGAGGYLCASPLIHLGHEHVGKAAASFALRVVLPIVGLFTGLLTSEGMSSGASRPDAREIDGVLGGVIGFGGGALLAATLDDVLIAREDVRPAHSDSHATLEPRISPARGGATVGIGGTF